MSLARRESLLRQYSEPFREVDRLIVTIGGGVLALSIALVSQVRNPNIIPYIQAAWISILVSICCVLGSLVAEQFDTNRRLDQLETNLPESDGLATRIVKILNWAGIFFFVLGLILVTVFLFAQTSLSA